MAPVAVDQYNPPQLDKESTKLSAQADSTRTKPAIKPSGLLDKYEHFDVTPVIGREFPKLDLTELLDAPNADELLTELAYIISSRGVVFFRAQDNLTNDLQKRLIQRIGELSGKPSTSTLHIHPVLNSEDTIDEERDPDQHISTISSKLFKKVYSVNTDEAQSPKRQNHATWHSDIAFEKAPADYSSLRLTQLPKTGGDTLWASGYEVYDRISAPFQKLIDSLTCTFAQPGFNEAARRGGFKLYEKPRGSPDNVGAELKAVHPVVRTNPVTGWRSLFSIGSHISHINAVTENESRILLKWFLKLVTDNHDLHVRFRWQNVNDIAIWDNRCTFHTATNDFEGLGDRAGNRAVGVGERPYFDPASKSRREAAELDGIVLGSPLLVS